jgi:hypothetical protein
MLRLECVHPACTNAEVGLHRFPSPPPALDQSQRHRQHSGKPCMQADDATGMSTVAHAHVRLGLTLHPPTPSAIAGTPPRTSCDRVWRSMAGIWGCVNTPLRRWCHRENATAAVADPAAHPSSGLSAKCCPPRPYVPARPPENPTRVFGRPPRARGSHPPQGFCGGACWRSASV